MKELQDYCATECLEFALREMAAFYLLFSSEGKGFSRQILSSSYHCYTKISYLFLILIKDDVCSTCGARTSCLSLAKVFAFSSSISFDAKYYVHAVAEIIKDCDTPHLLSCRWRCRWIFWADEGRCHSSLFGYAVFFLGFTCIAFSEHTASH